MAYDTGGGAAAPPYTPRKKQKKPIQKVAQNIKPYVGKGKPKPNRFGNKELTDSGTRNRSISRFNRLKALGINPGVTQAQIDKGGGARKLKRLLRDARTKFKSGPYRGKM